VAKSLTTLLEELRPTPHRDVPQFLAEIGREAADLASARVEMNLSGFVCFGGRDAASLPALFTFSFAANSCLTLSAMASVSDLVGPRRHRRG
jgi:hypothetical protein